MQLSANQTIVAAFIVAAVGVVLLNYAFTFTMTRVFNVRFINDRIPWSASELVMIAYVMLLFYALWWMVYFAKGVLEYSDNDEKGKECFMSCFPTSLSDVLVEVGIPFTVALLALWIPGKF